MRSKLSLATCVTNKIVFSVSRYNFVSNEIGAMQAVGRARKENSQCFLLVVADSEEHRRDKKIEKFISAMDGALNRYTKLNRPKWLEEIDVHQRKVYEDTRKKRANRKKNQREDPMNYVIVCKTCKEDIVPAFKIFLIENTSHYLIKHGSDDSEDEFEDKIIRDDGKESGVDIFCSHCKVNRIGFEVSYKKGCYYRGTWVGLSADGLMCKKTTIERQRPHNFTWGKVNFDVEHVKYSVDLTDFELASE